MVYEYLVKHGDKYYLPGENVPDDEPIVEESKAVENIVEKDSLEQAREVLEQKVDVAKKSRGRKPKA